MANDCILAVGDDSRVMFWDVNHAECISFADAGGGLPVSNHFFI
jgi:hypothetical protein